MAGVPKCLGQRQENPASGKARVGSERGSELGGLESNRCGAWSQGSLTGRVDGAS